jgi:hypothetical protein
VPAITRTIAATTAALATVAGFCPFRSGTDRRRRRGAASGIRRLHQAGDARENADDRADPIHATFHGSKNAHPSACLSYRKFGRCPSAGIRSSLEVPDRLAILPAFAEQPSESATQAGTASQPPVFSLLGTLPSGRVQRITNLLQQTCDLAISTAEASVRRTTCRSKKLIPDVERIDRLGGSEHGMRTFLRTLAVRKSDLRFP